MSKSLVGPLAALLAAGCLSPPEEDDEVLSVEVVPAQSVQLADGAGAATVRVRYDDATIAFRRELVVTVSSGELGAGSGDVPASEDEEDERRAERSSRPQSSSSENQAEGRAGGHVRAADASSAPRAAPFGSPRYALGGALTAPRSAR